MIATIHQPDFLPWFGFFNKVAKADVWIVLDHVKNNPRDAAFWGRRVRIMVNGRETWLSIPLDRPSASGTLAVPIREMTINRSDPRVFEKGLRTVRQAYARAPQFQQHEHLVHEYMSDDEPRLIVRNMRFIESVLATLRIDTRIVYSSDLGVTTSRTELLVDLLRAIGADTYLCGGGAAGYQEDELFENAGIRLEYNRFVHPAYQQLRTDTFIPGLSIIDALFCVPVDELADLVRSA